MYKLERGLWRGRAGTNRRTVYNAGYFLLLHVCVTAVRAGTRLAKQLQLPCNSFGEPLRRLSS